MKQLNYKCFLVLAILCMCLWKAKAQPFIYNTVAAGNQTLTGVALADTIAWYAWSNDSANFDITVNLSAQGSQYNFSNAQVYIDYGTAFQRVAVGVLSVNSMLIKVRNVDAHSNVYLRMPTTYCSTCTAGFPKVDITFRNVTAACPVNAGVPCELVLNGNMESSDLLCSGMSLSELPCNWRNAIADSTNNVLSNYSTDDYYNACAPTAPLSGCPGLQCVVNSTTNCTTNNLGNIAPHSGNGYCGIYMYNDSLASTYGNAGGGGYREYLCEKLNTPMLAGVTYNISMWVRIGNVSKYAIADFHLLASTAPVIQPLDPTGTYMVNIPSTGLGTYNLSLSGGAVNDTTQWTNLTGTITPTANCQYITIGNFYNRLHSHVLDRDPLMHWTYGDATVSKRHRGAAYYYFDDISITPATSYPPQTLYNCGGHSTFTLSIPNAQNQPAPMGYTWTAVPADPTLSGQTHSANPVVSPTVTTVYSLATGCSFGGTSITVSVQPVPVVSVSTTSTGICSGGSATLTATGSTNYTWSPGGATTATVVVTPTVPTVYTVTASNGGGCTTTATVQVLFMGNTCCSDPNATIGTSPTSTVSTSGAWSSQVIDIQGVVTFTSNSSFTSCTLRMAPNSRIQVSPGVTLTFAASKLYSCRGLWDGVQLLTSGTSAGNVSFQKSKIEDAYKAFYIDWAGSSSANASNGSISIGASVLNNNYIGVSIYNSPTLSANYPLSIGGSTFATKYTATSPNNGLKQGIGYTYAFTALNTNIGSYSAFPRGHMGIELNNVGYNVLIGDSNSTSNTNTFYNLNYGVNSYNSYASVYNNNFQQLRGSMAYGNPYPSLPAIGVGVFAAHSSTMAGITTLRVGTGTVTPTGTISPLPKGNSFYDCYIGVSATDNKQVYANGNSFTIDTTYVQPCAYVLHGVCQNPLSPLYMSFTGSDAVFATGLTQSGQMNYNYVSSCRSGLSVGLNLAAATASLAYVQQNHNYIVSGNDNRTQYCQYAINIFSPSNKVNLNPQAYQIKYNDMYYVYNCINASNVKGSLLIQSNNTIAVEANNTYGLGSPYRTGIRLIGCDGSVIANNRSINGNGSISSSNYWYVRGIWLQNSGNNGSFTGAKVNCNTLANLGRTMVFTGSCLNEVAQNYMTQGFHGLVLANNGMIGIQGTSTQSNDNIWNTTSGGGSPINAETYVESTSGANVNSYMYVKPNGANKYTPTYNYSNLANQQYSAPTGLVPVSNTVAATPCLTDAGHRMVNSQVGSNLVANANTADPLYDMLAGANTPYAIYDAETRYQNQRIVYRKMQAGAIPAFAASQQVQTFCTGAQNSSHGQFLAVDQQIEQGNFAAATAINNAVAATMPIEQYQQTINALVIKYSANPTYVFSASELKDLYTVADECLDRYGNVVAQARNLVQTVENHMREFPEKCGDFKPSPRRIGRQEAVTTTAVTENKVLLYPNPNNGSMTLDYALTENHGATLRLYHINGQQAGTYRLEGEHGRLQISADLPSGVYYYTIVNGDSLIKAEKVIIIR